MRSVNSKIEDIINNTIDNKTINENNKSVDVKYKDDLFRENDKKQKLLDIINEFDKENGIEIDYNKVNNKNNETSLKLENLINKFL